MSDGLAQGPHTGRREEPDTLCFTPQTLTNQIPCPSVTYCSSLCIFLPMLFRHLIPSSRCHSNLKFTSNVNEYVTFSIICSASDDVPRADEIRTLVKDIWDLRIAKLRSSIDIFVKSDATRAKVAASVISNAGVSGEWRCLMGWMFQMLCGGASIPLPREGID